MNEQNSKRYIEEDEIDLRELFKTIWDKKVFIVVFTAIVTVAAIVYALVKTPIYEARALVEIGNYKMHNNNNNNNNNNKVILDNASQLTKKLTILFVDMKKGELEKKSKVSSISLPKGSKELIEIKSLAVSNALAQKEINEIIQYIQTEHKKILDEVKQRREIEIKNVDSKISNIQDKSIPLLEEKIALQESTLSNFTKQIALIEENMKKIESSNPSLAALKLMEKRDLTSFTINMRGEILDLKDQKDTLQTIEIDRLKELRLTLSSLMLPHNYKNTHLIGEIMINDHPIKPNKKLIVVVAFVTGFILSIFIVFFMQFIAGFREEKSNS